MHDGSADNAFPQKSAFSWPQISTSSKYKTSFRKEVGENIDVIYLGKPRKLASAIDDGSEWISSNNEIAIVQNGIVTGLREGVVTITHSLNGDILDEQTFAITTFNDGRQPEFSYELEPEDFDRLLYGENGMPQPEYLKQNINTIRDVISYLQISGFSTSDNIPFMANMVTDWYWMLPADYLLTANQGWIEDAATIACYLLQNDFEDSGVILRFGYNFNVFNWFYEDGYYYVFDFENLIRDFRGGIRDADYSIYKTDSLDKLSEYVLSLLDAENTLTTIMFSACGHDFIPAYRLNYLHDSSTIYHEHSQIAMEASVVEQSRILFSNPHLDYELIGIPVEEIPSGLPTYGNYISYKY